MTWSWNEDGDDVVGPAGSSALVAHQTAIEPDNQDAVAVNRRG